MMAMTAFVLAARVSTKPPASLYTAREHIEAAIAPTQVLSRRIGPVLEATFFDPESNIRVETPNYP